VGDLLVLFAKADAAGITVSSVSGGGVSLENSSDLGRLTANGRLLMI
jgi:hypothetical protein